MLPEFMQGSLSEQKRQLSKSKAKKASRPSDLDILMHLKHQSNAVDPDNIIELANTKRTSWPSVADEILSERDYKKYLDDIESVPDYKKFGIAFGFSEDQLEKLEDDVYQSNVIDLEQESIDKSLKNASEHAERIRREAQDHTRYQNISNDFEKKEMPSRMYFKTHPY